MPMPRTPLCMHAVGMAHRHKKRLAHGASLAGPLAVVGMCPWLLWRGTYLGKKLLALFKTNSQALSFTLPLIWSMLNKVPLGAMIMPAIPCA